MRKINSEIYGLYRLPGQSHLLDPISPAGFFPQGSAVPARPPGIEHQSGTIRIADSVRTPLRQSERLVQGDARTKQGMDAPSGWTFEDAALDRRIIVAWAPDGREVVSTLKNDFLRTSFEFELVGRESGTTGKISINCFEDQEARCNAITWIEKSNNVPGGAMDLAICWLTRRSTQPYLEVRNILNVGLFACLSTAYPMEQTDDSLRGCCIALHRIAADRLAKRGWSMK
jgi:hypothetical protein